MNLVAEMALKSAVIFLVALAIATLLRRHSAAVRHLVLAASFVCAAALPALTMWAPEWHLPVPDLWLRIDAAPRLRFASTPPPTSALPPTPEAPQPESVPIRTEALPIVIGVWLTGALAVIVGTCAGMWRIRRVARRARLVQRGVWRQHADDIVARFGICRSIRLLHSTHPTMLVTWGLIQPYILLPVDATAWSDERIRIVLYHELAHVQRHDWAILIGARLMCALHWFNPLVWIAFRRLREETECACDDIVLGRGIRAPDYASHLLAVARETVLHRRSWSAATAIAHPSTLEGRVRAMLNEGLDRTPLTRHGRWVTAVVALAIVLAIAGASAATAAAPVDVPTLASQASGEPVNPPPAPQSRIELSNVSVIAGSARIGAARFHIEAAAAAQNAPGVLRGVLYDQLGGVLPGAQVRLVNKLDGGTYNTTTDRNGAFLFTALPPGDYEFTTSLAGFAPVSNLIKIVVGETIERAVTLPIGTLEETISVSNTQRQQYPPRTDRRRSALTRSAPEPRTFFSGGIGGQIQAPAKLVHVSPLFPPEASTVSDVVMLTGRVGIDGFINDLREVRPDIASARAQAFHAVFVSSALDAVRQWEFSPVLLNNVPVEANITITVDYRSQ